MPALLAGPLTDKVSCSMAAETVWFPLVHSKGTGPDVPTSLAFRSLAPLEA